MYFFYRKTRDFFKHNNIKLLSTILSFYNSSTISLQLHVVLNYELEQKILSFGQYVEVISPMTLRERIKDRLSQSLLQYNP